MAHGTTHPQTPLTKLNWTRGPNRQLFLFSLSSLTYEAAREEISLKRPLSSGAKDFGIPPSDLRWDSPYLGRDQGGRVRAASNCSFTLSNGFVVGLSLEFTPVFDSQNGFED